MKKTYVFSMKTLAFIILCTVSIYIMLCNGVELYKYNHPHSLNELSAGDKLINEYVECKIDRYIVTPVSEYLTDQYTGQSELYFDFFNDYITYTIPVNGDKYVRVQICDKKIVDELEAYEMGQGNPVYFIGKITEGSSFNTSWYKDIEGFDVSDIYSNIMIAQSKESPIKNTLILSVFLLLISIIGIVKNFYTLTIEDKPNSNEIYTYSYNARNELMYKRQYLARLIEQQTSIRRWSIAGVYFVIFGGSVTLTNYWWEIKIFGVVLVFIGIKQIYKAFINSDNRFALRIASIFEIDTVNHKKKMCVRRIEYLENQIREDEQKTNKNMQ